MAGLMFTGNSGPMAQFQSLGIAAFAQDDVHQTRRIRGSQTISDDLHLNYDLWNPETECSGRANLNDGRPCNANIGFQQHGFSTTVRDWTDGSSAKSRWNNWMKRSGVLTYDPSFKLFDKVMKIEGMAKLLEYARLEGEKSGEFALNGDNSFRGSPLSFYHPSVGGSSNEQKACSQWQAVGAWAAFWAAFAQYTSDGKGFMAEEDLKRFFFDGKFPSWWTAKPWGFKDTFKVVREMQGMGAGEEWVEQIVNILNTVGEEGSERQYMGGLLGALTHIGSRRDDVHKDFVG